MKQIYWNTIEKIIIYQFTISSSTDELYELNRRKNINQQQKDYYEKNREKIQEKNARLVKCECGRQIQHGSISSHKKTANHISKMQSIINPPIVNELLNKYVLTGGNEE